MRALAYRLLERVTGQMQRPITGSTPAALAKLFRYPWPGNVRELENAVECACALAMGDVIDVDDLPLEVRDHRTLTINSEDVRPLRDVERDYILALLERNQGSKTVTAQQLRIGLATLRRELNSYRKTW